MQLKLRRTNDAELVERKRKLMARLGEQLGESRFTLGELRYLATPDPFRCRSALFTMSCAA
ncbi:hypothetical protein HMPREF3170_03980 [Corynebacterium sp. HMSC08D02]|nr:hypothetical protein HMPREF3170_03980 [Corynebacterium sp. HMSC08D02]